MPMLPISRKHLASLIILVIPLMTASCAHKRAFKRAQSLEGSGRYVEAAEQDLIALDKKPEFEDAKTHLRRIAPIAYQELIDRASGQESRFEWIEAIRTYEYTETILTRFTRHGINLQSTDVGSRLARAKLEGTNYYYTSAEDYYRNGDFVNAIDQYKKVVTVAGFHQDTKRKLWRSHVELGNQRLRDRQFQSAIESCYRPALEYVEYSADETATKNFIAEAYYRWADYLESEGDSRGAYEKFQSALATVPGYRDAEERSRESYEAAVSRIAVMPFRNSTSYGVQYANLLTEQLINRCVNANLDYAVFATREYIEQVMQEHALAAAGAVDPATASEIGMLEGIDYFVIGNLTQISEQTTRPSFVEREHKIRYTAPDSTGKEVEHTRSIFYREYTSRRTVEVAASFQIIAVESARIVRGEDVTETVVSEARWIRYQGSIEDLPRDKRSLLDAPTEPRSADMLTNDGMRSLAQKLSERIIGHFR